MLRSIFIIILSQFIVLCSEKSENTRIGSIVSEENAKDTGDEDEEDEEEITAVPPTVISGQYLMCYTVSKDKEKETIDITCHLEKESVITKEFDLFESDISVKNDGGDNIALDFANQGDGTYLIKAALQSSSNIHITLVSIRGGEIITESEVDKERFKSVITIQDIDDVKDVVEINQESKDFETEDAGAENEEENQSERGTRSEQGLPNNQESRAAKPLDCESIGTPGSWITVPGDPDYGTSDFCVMKYEAKCSMEDGQECVRSEQIPRSTPENTPWVKISQLNAIAECNSLGDGFHLMTNDEWMTLGTNIVGVNENWVNGSGGQKQLKRGHSDNNPPAACAGSDDDTLNIVEDDCMSMASSTDADKIQERTQILSNGEVIWDLSGNVWEWTNYFNHSEKPTPLGMSWSEFTDLVATQKMPLTELVPQIAIDSSWNSTHGIGQYYPGDNLTGGSLRRGGRWQNDAGAGVFASALDHSRMATDRSFGFRCTYSLP